MISGDLLFTILVYYCVIGFIFASIAHVVSEYVDSAEFMLNMWAWPLLTLMIMFSWWVSFLDFLRRKLRGL